MTIDPAAQIASTRHTLILTSILLLIALAGFLSLRHAGNGGGAAAGPMTYFGLIAAELGLLYYVRVGVRARGVTLRELVSDLPMTWRRVAASVGLGLVLLLLLVALEWLLDRLLGAGDQRLVRQLVVHRLADVPLWLLLSAAAGVVEEITFRGYFQRQFGVWLRSPWAAVVGQAILFGITHGYQGPALIVRITILGIVFGVVAKWRRSLIPGIVGHFGLDVIGGLSGLH